MKKFLAFFILLPALAWASQKQSFEGKVTAVKDGDTIEVLNDKTPIKIRLAGIDCPEKKQAFGMRAKQFTSDLAFGKMVRVEVMDRDRYGRSVGEVTLPDGKSLNQEIVRAGLAWWYRKYAPKNLELEKLEREAREEKKGLWAEKDPVPAWEFRHK